LDEARRRPNDEFMRKHLLRLVAAWTPQDFKRAVLQASDDDLFLKALFFEACLLLKPFAALRGLFPKNERGRLAKASPLVFIKAHRQTDHRLHRRWIDRLRPNFLEHEALPAPDAIGLPPPVDVQSVARAMAVEEPLERLERSEAARSGSDRAALVEPAAMTALALERLAAAGIQVGGEMRHEASLSPIALLRNWQLAVSVDCGRHRYRLQGEQIAFGRGLELEAARVACVMEVVERVSAYAGIAGDEVVGRETGCTLVHARLSELIRRGRAALDPNRLGLEAPYRDEPLYWVEGQAAGKEGPYPILVPAQCLFLFCNLDEIKLFSGLGSNGLGAGSSHSQAKCQALLELIERDSAATIPHVPALCFDVETGEDRIANLLRSYAVRGIQVGFLDLTGPLGVPCCKCFVVDSEGRVAAGTAAALDARKALVSALTETPYPFPNGPPSRPLPPAAVRVPLEVLPNYDRGDAEQNLVLLERLLQVNGFEPIYVDLTRSDIGLPVVRAIIPGMEMMGDFDRFSRVHPRLFGHYLRYAQPLPAGRGK
jgi:ribosomal protein S12 methylthiotransferase accessory factor YcaO